MVFQLNLLLIRRHLRMAVYDMSSLTHSISTVFNLFNKVLKFGVPASYVTFDLWHHSSSFSGTWCSFPLVVGL